MIKNFLLKEFFKAVLRDDWWGVNFILDKNISKNP